MPNEMDLILNLLAVLLAVALLAARFEPVIRELRDPGTPPFGSKAWHWPAVVFCMIGLLILCLLRIYAA